MAKTNYKVNGKTYVTLTAVAKALGKSRVYRKDFDKLNITEIEVVTDTAVATITSDTAVVTDTAVATITVGSITSDTAVVAVVESDTAVTVAVQGESEVFKTVLKKLVDGGMSVVAFKKELRNLTTTQLIDVVKEIGGNVWETLKDDTIRRMRLVMELKGYYYPQYKVVAKQKSPWTAVTTDKLLETAKAKGAVYKDCADEKILRMRVIVALKAFGVQAEDIK